MKKTLVALFALSGVSMGATLATIDLDDQNLKTYFNFDENNSPVTSSISWSELPTWNRNGYGVSTSNNTHPYADNAGLKATDGFTISFDVNSVQNGTLLSFTTGRMDQAWRTASITYTDGEFMAKFHGGDNIVGATTLNLTSDDWTTLTLVVSGDTDNNLLLDFYVNGSLVGEKKVGGASNFVGETANKIQFGYYGTAANSAPTNIDNILVYNRALSAEEVAALVVPEPATASLSLLGLAALMIRRRR